MDDSHNKTREELLVVQSGGSAEYLMAGIKGFGYGLFGGMTSLVQQAYKGTRDEGIEVNVLFCLLAQKSGIHIHLCHVLICCVYVYPTKKTLHLSKTFALKHKKKRL